MNIEKAHLVVSHYVRNVRPPGEIQRQGMASYHCTVKVGGKGKAASHSAYISREGKYSGRERYEDLESTDYGNMPKWAEHNPAHFWNAADQHERANGATYREVEVALPRELTPEQRRELVEDFIDRELGGKHAYQWAIHTPTAALEGDEQPHAHIMYSERTVDGIDRDPEQYFRRYNSKAPEKGGCRKDSAGTEERLQATRKLWADVQNTHLERHGHEVRVDHRSLKEQGIDRRPEKHIGASRVKDMQESDIAALLTRRAAEGELERAQRMVSSLIDLSGDLAAALAEPERIERMNSAEIAAEIGRLRGHDLVAEDSAVRAAVAKLEAQCVLHRQGTREEARAEELAEQWRERHKVLAWMHAREWGYSQDLRALEAQREAGRAQWMAAAQRIEEASAAKREAEADARERVWAEQAGLMRRIDELEALRQERAREEVEPVQGREVERDDSPGMSL